MRFLTNFVAFLLIVLSNFVCWAGENTQKTAHIYVDLASIPALLQMVDAVKQPADDPKLFIWKRFHTLPPDDLTLKELNGTMPDAKSLGEQNYDLFIDFVDEHVTDFYQKYPDYMFVIHLNLFHSKNRSGHIFDIIPEKQIQSVHLYEDAIGRSYWDGGTERTFLAFNETSAPKYLHFGGFVSKQLSLTENQLILEDFQEIEKTLSVKQKSQIAKFVGFDSSQLSQIYLKRPTAVFLDDPSLTVEKAEMFLEKLMKDKRLKTYTWLYKNHPRVSEKTEVFELLNKLFPTVLPLPNAMPLESLILCGYRPTYIAGYGSSVFFSFKAEQILGYIKRNYLETYLHPLLELGILTPEKVFPSV